MPRTLASCHSAIVDGYMIEGHVPISDVKRLLATRPAGVKGIAVAGMPIGSEGMEVAGAARQRSEEHTSELQSLMRTSYAVFCLKKKLQSQKIRHFEHRNKVTAFIMNSESHFCVI